MFRTMLTLAAGVSLGMVGMTLAHHDGQENVKPLSSIDITEQIAGKATKATAVEVSLDPGQAGSPHRHPGPVFGYVLEGQYELGIDDKPTKIVKQGETFYEPTGCLHRVSKNPAAKGKTRVLAWVLHPQDAKEVAIPEAKK